MSSCSGGQRQRQWQLQWHDSSSSSGNCSGTAAEAAEALAEGLLVNPGDRFIHLLSENNQRLVELIDKIGSGKLNGKIVTVTTCSVQKRLKKMNW